MRTRFTPRLLTVSLAVAMVLVGIISSGAFTAVTADRTAAIDMVGDAESYLGVAPHSGPNGAYAYVTGDGLVEISLTGDNPNQGVGGIAGGEGVMGEAQTVFDDVVNVSNQGTQSVEVWIEDDTDDVSFYATTNDHGSIDGAANAIPLSPGATGEIGIAVDTTSESGDARLLETIELHATEISGVSSPGDGTATWYLDADGDGYGTSTSTQEASTQPTGHVATAGDCADEDPNIHPGAPEDPTDGLDNDCDGQVDEDASDSTWYQDSDGDGFGTSLTTQTSSTQPAGYVATAGDCDDSNVNVHPGAPDDTADGIDNDCDGEVDEGVTDDGGVSTVANLSAGDLVINEFMKNPEAQSDSEGEWFEVSNAKNEDVDLEGLVIEDSGSDTHTVTGSVVVPSGGYIVFARSSTGASAAGFTADYEYDSFVFGNSDDEIILSTGTAEIDRIEYDDGVTWVESAGSSRSLDPSFQNAADNDVGSNWCAGQDLLASGDFGSPGAPNPACS